jgi:small-conductance mechanosensitive channel
MNVETLLQQQLLGNPVLSWLHAGLAFFATAVGVRLLLRFLAMRLAAFAERTETRLDDAAVGLIRQTKWWVLAAFGIYVAARFLDIPDRPGEWIRVAAAVALIVQIGIWVSELIGVWIENSRRRRMNSTPAAATGLYAIGIVGRLILWSVVLLMILDNLGVNVTALIASLGVGGVAVALAVQNILGDLFASFSIIFDKPFVVGDFLVIDDYMGSVEHVGLKTTRVRSLTGEQLVFSNSDLLGSRIRNFGRMNERRVAFEIGVTYQTSRDKLKRIPDMLKAAIEKQSQTRFDRAHFKSFGDFSLIFETVYYVGVPDYNVHMDIQQAVNLGIHEAFEREGIDFAYPTQTLFMRRDQP